VNLKKPLLLLAFTTACIAMGPAARAEEGVTKTAVVLGQSVALTGPSALLSQSFAQGAKLYFDRINAAGGVNGRSIELITLDDGGQPDTTVANTCKLIAQGVLSLFGYYGSPQLTAAYASIKGNNVMFFAPMAAADEFCGSLYPNVYSIRPGYDGFSNTGESLLSDRLGPLGSGVVVARVVPKSDSVTFAVVRELQADMAAAKLGKPNVYLLEGYIAARVYAVALGNAGKEPTRAKLRQAMDGLVDVNIGDFRAHFAQDRVASRLVQLDVIDSQGHIRK
jgi:ABC-type branched-subunit amino acid transport system substrate-binding protein